MSKLPPFKERLRAAWRGTDFPATPVEANTPNVLPDLDRPVTPAPRFPSSPTGQLPMRCILHLPASWHPVDGLGAALRIAAEREHGVVWQPVEVEPTDNGWSLTLADKPGAVGIEYLNLGDDIKATDGQRLAVYAERQGKSLVEFDPVRRTAVFAKLTQFDVMQRDRIATALHVAPWDLELITTWAAPTDGEVAHIDNILVLRAPHLDSTHREAIWREVIESVVWGGSSGWAVDYIPTTGQMLLTYHPAIALPGHVDLVDVLPERMMVSDWASIPLGLDPEGEVVALNLSACPHTMCIGPTGSGKTVGMLAAISSALCRGYELVIVDATKMAIDFTPFRPWASAWAENLTESEAVLEAVYAESIRRRNIRKLYGAGSWIDLAPEVLIAERIRPIFVVIDEYVSMVIERAVPKNLDREHPLLQEIQDVNLKKIVIADTVGKLARESRADGIFLLLAAQRPDAKFLGGEMRFNFASRVQFCPPGQLLSRDALSMVFDGDQPAQASSTLARLDDGKSRGLAVVAAEGGSVRGLRVAHCAPAEIPKMLELIGVPKATPWVLPNRAGLTDEPDDAVESGDESEPEGDVDDPWA